MRGGRGIGASSFTLFRSWYFVAKSCVGHASMSESMSGNPVTSPIRSPSTMPTRCAPSGVTNVASFMLSEVLLAHQVEHLQDVGLAEVLCAEFPVAGEIGR